MNLLNIKYNDFTPSYTYRFKSMVQVVHIALIIFSYLPFATIPTVNSVCSSDLICYIATLGAFTLPSHLKFPNIILFQEYSDFNIKQSLR